MFDWKNATTEECVWHVAKVSPQHTTAVLTYYKKQNNESMLTKIKEARKLAKRYRVLIRAEVVTEEILKEGLNNASDNPIQATKLDK